MISMCSVMLELLKGALEAESLVKPFFLMIGLQVRNTAFSQYVRQETDMTLPTECRWTIIFRGSVSEVLSSLLEPL